MRGIRSISYYMVDRCEAVSAVRCHSYDTLKFGDITEVMHHWKILHLPVTHKLIAMQGMAPMGNCDYTLKRQFYVKCLVNNETKNFLRSKIINFVVVYSLQIMRAFLS
jgi:hypothetical protein